MQHIGGAQQVVHQQAEALATKGHDVHVLTAPDSVYKGAYHLHTIPHLKRNVSLHEDWKAVWETRQNLRRLKPDVLTIHSTKAGTIGRLATIGTGIPNVYTFHGISYVTTATRGMRILGRLHEKLFSTLTDRYIFLTKYDQKTMRLPARKCAIIPNGIHEKPILVRENYSDVLRLLWVGRLSPPKDPLPLIEALANFTDSKWKLDIVGTGTLDHELTKRIDGLGLADRIKLHGEVSDPHPFYEECDVVVLLSKSEGIPLVLLEAMAHQKPIIASATNGIETIIEEGQTGYIVRQTIQPYLDYVFKHSDKLEIMGKKGYQRFRKHFTFHQMIRATEDLLSEVAKKK
ncbi:glycosyltransferase [Chryseomicrobium palamuruense]|uniref:Glycosyltransferase n=1 Tax=Chryseomicrobium palamuruense TaxID=682973 RepID=A0ABV8UWD4_9BACL